MVSAASLSRLLGIRFGGRKRKHYGRENRLPIRSLGRQEFTLVFELSSDFGPLFVGGDNLFLTAHDRQIESTILTRRLVLPLGRLDAYSTLGNDVVDDVSVDICQAEVATLEPIGQLFVVDAQQM